LYPRREFLQQEILVMSLFVFYADFLLCHTGFSLRLQSNDFFQSRRGIPAIRLMGACGNQPVDS
jgi:hypothetical protein